LLDFTAWGITLNSTIFSLGLVTVVLSALAWWRRRSLPIEEFSALVLSLPRLPWRGTSQTDWALNLFLGSALLLALGSMGYAYLSPKSEERFTEFYILGQEGKIAFSQSAKVGEPFPLIVGVKNHEGQRVAYRVKTRLGREGEPQEQWALTLEDGQGEEREIVLSLPQEGAQDIEFLLYRDDGQEPYRELYLWVNVMAPGAGYTDFQAFIQPGRLKGRDIEVQVIITNHEGRDASYQVFAQGSWQSPRPVLELYLAKTQVIRLANGRRRSMVMGVELAVHPGVATTERVYLYLFKVGELEPIQVVSIPVRAFRSK
jgi:uncharacterized membrane protein